MWVSMAKQRALARVLAAVVVLSAGWMALADEHFPLLKAGSEVYSNVTVTSVTATDIYFTHARGMGNAKLQNLDPELREHFKFNAEKAGKVEKQQLQDNAQYRAVISAPKADRPPAPTIDDDGNILPPKLFAKSCLGQRPPQIIVDEWLTPPPDVNGKFVLLEFWTSWGEPCLKVIPHLNTLHAKFKDRLVIIGLSNETADNLRKMTSLRIDYSIGTDTQSRTLNALDVQGIPHAILIDPQGIVRFEGLPEFLTEKGLASLMDRYTR